MAERSFASICSMIRGVPSGVGGGWVSREDVVRVPELFAVAVISAVAPLTSDTVWLARAVRPEALGARAWLPCPAANVRGEADGVALVSGVMVGAFTRC